MRSDISDYDYIKDTEFLKYYQEFGDTPENALINIKNVIENIDEAFIDSLVTEEEFILYRGTQDCFLYDGMNLGFISTSISYNAALKFQGDKGCIYEIHVGIGIPYIRMESLSKYNEEKEILLPRNLITILREKIENRYIVDVVLNRDDQFIFDKEYKKYNSYTIEGFTYIKNKTIDNITHLNFNKSSNENNVLLPNNITHLTFSDNFSQALMPGLIPNNITNLNFKNTLI